MNSDNRRKLLTQSRIPDFMGGDLDVVIRNSLMSQSKSTGYTIEEYESIYNDIFNLGDTAGFERAQPIWYEKGYSYGYVHGVTTGVTEFALSGASKLLVTSDPPAVYPINNMEQLYHSSTSNPLVGRFLDQQAVDVLIPKQEQQFRHSLERVNEYTSKKIAVTEYEMNQLMSGMSSKSTKELNSNIPQIKSLSDQLELYKNAKSSNFSGDYLKNESTTLKKLIFDLAKDLNDHRARNGYNTVDTIGKINNAYLKKHFTYKDGVDGMVYKDTQSEEIITKRILLSDYLEDYAGLSSIHAQKVRLENTKAKITDHNGEYIPSKLRMGFTPHKNRETAIFHGPGWTLHDLKQIQKQTLQPIDKKAPLKTLQERSKEVAEFNEQEYLKNVSDHSEDKSAKDVYEHMNFKTPKKKTPKKKTPTKNTPNNTPKKSRFREFTGKEPSEKLMLTANSYTGK